MDRAELIERLEKTAKRDRSLSAEIHWHFLGKNEPYFDTLHCTASIDAAVALVERVLPGWTWYVGSGENGAGDDGSVAGVYPPKEPSKVSKGDHATPAIAILIALLKATQ